MAKAIVKAAPAIAAPGPFLGFTQQTFRFVKHLLNASSGATIFLEVLDDISVENSAGAVLLEQDASALTYNPVGDKSEKIWKTLLNWVLAVESGDVDPTKTNFVLFVLQPKDKGPIVTKLHAVKDSTQAVVFLSELRSFIKQTESDSKQKGEPLPQWLRTAKKVAKKPDATLANVIVRTAIEFGSGAPVDEILGVLNKHPIKPDLRIDVAQKLLGWAQDRLTKQISQKIPARVCYDDFHPVYVRTVQIYSGGHLPLPPFSKVPGEAALIDLIRSSKFAEQMRLVQCGDDFLIEAAIEFMRAAEERTLWCQKGEVVSRQSFDDFDKAITAYWRKKKQITETAYKHQPAEERGKLLWAECALHREKLEGRDTPDFYTPGSFHTLSNEMRLGWHPDYEKLIKR